MKHILRTLIAVALLAGTFAPLAMAAEMPSLVRFRGGIGVNPVSSVVGTDLTGLANRNVVRGISPGGQPWVIESLKADVRVDGRIRVDGRGLLLAGGNNIGTTGGNPQRVRATLFCGSDVGFSSDLVDVEPNGDFRIDDVLTPPPPHSCDKPVLLIVSANGRWFAAGIPVQKD